MPRLLPLFLLALLLGACRPEAPEQPAPMENYEAVGEAITPEDAVPVRTVAAEAGRYVGQPVKLEGTIAKVCQMKGCWLTLDAGDGQAVRVAVPRNAEGDYVFTFPTDVSGRRVVVQGELSETTLSEETQRHLAEDAGETLEEVKPKPELHLAATGALVEKRVDV